MKKLSIIMPVYNPGIYLNYSLRSIENQKFPLDELELIAVDDCSSDHSLETLRNYQMKSPFCMNIISFGKNRGVSAARNEGANASNGDLLLLLDSDDLLHPDCVGECVSEFEQDRSIDFVYTEHVSIKPDAKFPLNEGYILSIKTKPEFEINHFLENDYNYVGHVKVVRKSSNILFNEQMHYSEDADWIVRLGLNGAKFKHIPKPLYYWRRGIPSLTSRHSVEERKRLHDKAFRREK